MKVRFIREVHNKREIDKKITNKKLKGCKTNNKIQNK